MTTVLASVIAAAGTVLSAYVAHVAVQTRSAVNGRVSELQARVELLEELLTWQRGQEPSGAGGPYASGTDPI